MASIRWLAAPSWPVRICLARSATPGGGWLIDNSKLTSLVCSLAKTADCSPPYLARASLKTFRLHNGQPLAFLLALTDSCHPSCYHMFDVSGGCSLVRPLASRLGSATSWSLSSQAGVGVSITAFCKACTTLIWPREASQHEKEREREKEKERYKVWHLNQPPAQENDVRLCGSSRTNSGSSKSNR